MKQRLFSLIMIASLLSCAPKEGDITASQTWYYRAFGQSTDLFFDNSANATGQNGINHAWINPTWDYNDARYVQSTTDLATALPADQGVKLKPTDIIVVESRGGKIADGHDGMTFFYTRMPNDRNFVLEATMTLTAAGPHPENKGTRGKPVASFQQQSGGGLIVRDIIANHRQDPSIEGFEELPAVANFTSTGFLAGKILPDERRVVNAGTLYRDGHTSFLGTVGVGRMGKREIELVVGQPYHYRIERKNEGFFVTLIDATTQEVLLEESPAGEHDLALRIDATQMYLGIGMMREGRIVAQNLTLTDTGKNQGAPSAIPTYQSKATLQVKSPTLSSTKEYTLALFSNRDAELTIHGLPNTIQISITREKELYLPINLNEGENPLRIIYRYDNEQQLEENLTITVDSNLPQGDLYVSPQGNGRGTLTNPASLENALLWLQPNQTLYLLSGTYTTPIHIKADNGGLPSRYKTIMPAENAQVWINSHMLLEGNYWHIKDLLIGGTSEERIDVSGSGTLGNAVVNILGNYNILEGIIAEYGTGTGINIGNRGIFKEFFPKYNQILYSEARHNADPAGNNADGFGAKRVGPGNYFYGNIAHHNIDDGWDLFNPIDAGASEPVIIEGSIAYNNGRNGFKLGGEGLPVAHQVRNSLAFDNGMAGFSDNFNPGALLLEFNTSVDNGDQNFLLRDNALFPPQNQLSRNISWRTDPTRGKNDYISGVKEKMTIWVDSKASLDDYLLSSQDFVSTIAPSSYLRDKNREIIWGDFMRISQISSLRNRLGNEQIGVAYLF